MKSLNKTFQTVSYLFQNFDIKKCQNENKLPSVSQIVAFPKNDISENDLNKGIFSQILFNFIKEI